MFNKKPIALRNAKKMAEEVAGRTLSYDRVEIVTNENDFKVYYTLPRTYGFFICNLPLEITWDEYNEYQDWVMKNPPLG